MHFIELFFLACSDDRCFNLFLWGNLAHTGPKQDSHTAIFKSFRWTIVCRKIPHYDQLTGWSFQTIRRTIFGPESLICILF